LPHERPRRFVKKTRLVRSLVVRVTRADRPRPEPKGAADDAAWLEAFWRGDHATLEGTYRAYFAAAERAIGSMLSGADRETVIHEVFSRLIASEDLRRSFSGGAFGAWLATVTRNQAIDHKRRLGREAAFALEPAADAPPWQEAAEARLLIERFRRDHVRPEWAGVFELRFLRQMTQHEASHALGIRRTTLAYRELRVRQALRRFLLEDERHET
jgi:RNA polymerase sigma-70 factor (ECF subfamily)